MYKRQFYQIAESNQIEKKIDSVARIESNRIETFLPELGCSTIYWHRVSYHLALYQLSVVKVENLR